MERQREREEGGFVIIVLLTLLIPMLLVVGAFSVTMTGRTNELNVEMDEERALMAAEAGVDDAIYKAQTSALLNGMTYSRTLANGLSFESVATYLKTDGVDNDGDGNTDEDDEDVYQIVVTGSSRSKARRLAAYLGPTPLFNVDAAAMAVQNPNVTLDLMGTPLISGNDVDMNGVPTGDTEAGISVAPPGTVADLDAELTGSERTQVTGDGFSLGPPVTPSLDVASEVVDLTVLVPQLQNAANIVLTGTNYANYSFGDGPAGDFNITYREGNVRFSGNSQGAGVLVVTGNLTLTGTFRFDGIIIVLGDVKNASGTADVYGTIIQGPAGGLIETKGTMTVQYSDDAISKTQNAVLQRYVAFNGWQELSR